MKFYSLTTVNYDHTTSASDLFLTRKYAELNLSKWTLAQVQTNQGYIEFINVDETEFDESEKTKALLAAKSASRVLIELTDNNRLEGVITEFDIDNDIIMRATIFDTLQKDVYDKIKF